MSLATWEIEGLLPDAIKEAKKIRPDLEGFIEQYYEKKHAIMSAYKSGSEVEELSNAFAGEQIRARIIVESWLRNLQPTIII
jgi:hypothetical protein